jgi:hypothetical protein
MLLAQLLQYVRRMGKNSYFADGQLLQCIWRYHERSNAMIKMLYKKRLL